MKNKPQRERQARRPSSYTRNGKRPYVYPAWVTDKRQPIPYAIGSQMPLFGVRKNGRPLMTVAVAHPKEMQNAA